MRELFVQHPWLVPVVRRGGVWLFMSICAALLWFAYKEAESADLRERALNAANRED